MTPAVLAEYLKVMRDAGLMQARLVTTEFELVGTFAPEAMPMPGTDAPAAGGWKTDLRETPSDPSDPDPLGLGALDAPIAFDDPEVTP